MAPRRILHVLGTADVAGNAICQYVEYLAAGIDPDEFLIEACFLCGGEFVYRFASRGINSVCLEWNGTPRDLSGASRYARLLATRKFDLIHQHTGGRFLSWMSRSLTRAKVILHLHGRSSDDAPAIPAKMHLPKRDATIANSRIVANACGDPRAIVIYPGIDVDNFHADRPTGVTGKVIGTASRLEPVKGITTLIEAIGIVARKRPSIRLEIAGKGSLRSALEQDAARIGVTSNVSFLGWREDVPALMRSWHIFVLPSLDEGFGLAALEAMASGLPVIASDEGGLRELILDSQTGFLVPVGSPEAIANKIELLLDDADLRTKMGMLGRERARETFSLAAMVKKSSALYTKLLSGA